MDSLDKFGAVLAVALLSTLAYMSMSSQTFIEKVLVPYETTVTDTLTVTQVDTLWKFHTWEDDIIRNEDNLIVSMSFLLHIADDNEIANQIRNALPFGEVFNYWREEIGPSGLFMWNENLYLTLFKEESITDCEVYD